MAWVTRAPEPHSRRGEPGEGEFAGNSFWGAIVRQLTAGSGAGSWLGAQTWGHRVEKETGSGTEQRAGGMTLKGRAGEEYSLTLQPLARAIYCFQSHYPPLSTSGLDNSR